MPALTLLAALGIAPGAQAAAGDRDTSLAGDGIATWDGGKGLDLGLSVALQPDGKVLVAGRTYSGSDDDLALARFNGDGSLDTGFSAGDGDGVDGVAIWDGGKG
ncbi:MAG TPA: delta-60 repeat domain-containing protein, partial [Gammaproteobacteria bacterium]|nr:delta-60 repeat domain-containing protein [Gammaproteobacteria bacterium]